MVNTQRLAAAEMCYQHLAYRDNEEELTASDSGDGHSHGRGHLILVVVTEKQKLFQNHSCQNRSQWNAYLDLSLLSFPISCGWSTHTLIQPRKKSEGRRTCVKHSIEVNLYWKKKSENGDEVQKQTKNNQNIGLSLVQVYVYNKFIEVDLLGQRAEAFVIFIDFLISPPLRDCSNLHSL